MKSDGMWGWHIHGVSDKGKWSGNGQEYFTECPFCLSSDGFYINPHKGAGVYSCKVCSQQGSYLTFLKEIQVLNEKELADTHLQALADDRELPIDALRGLQVGWNGKAFTFPVYDIDENFVGLQWYVPGEKIMNSPNTKMSLFNIKALKAHLNGPIFICEGMWDGLALKWLLKEVEVKGTVVAVPGANINISPWETFFYGHPVTVIYDHDRAGIEGEFKVWQALAPNKAKSLHFVHWPEKKKPGYDIRDLIIKWAVNRGNPHKVKKLLEKWLSDVPRKLTNMAVVTSKGELTFERRKEELKPISFQELIEVYREYLYLPNIDPIRVMLGTIFANRFRSDMVWLFLVAPPSSGKSELIMSLESCQEVELVSTVTEHTFISGYIGAGNTDVSLFGKLRDRIMAIKDFTPILQTIPAKQQMIFGTLRDAYDGRTDAMFGHAENRRYQNLHFGIIAGVTAEIEKFGYMQQTLGERFLRYYLPVRSEDKDKIMEKADNNIGFEKARRDKLKHAVYRFLETNKAPVPKRSDKIKEQIRNIAAFTAALRGVVPRDWKERVLYHPSKEGPSRLDKQLTLLTMGLASLEQKEEVGAEEIRLIREVALSTCPDVVRTVMYALHKTGKTPMTQKNLEEKTGFPIGTIKFAVDDLKMLGLIEATGTAFKNFYTLSEVSKELIQRGNIYPIEVSAVQRP